MKIILDEQKVIDFISAHFEAGNLHCKSHDIDPEGDMFSLILAYQYSGLASFLSYLGDPELSELFKNASLSCVPEKANATFTEYRV